MKTKRRKADALFSEYIRKRDKGICQRCYKKGSEIHHHFGRRYWNTRFSPANAVTVCFTCHRIFHENPLEHVRWWKKRLGDKAYQQLNIQAIQISKRDWKLEEIKLKALMNEKN